MDVTLHDDFWAPRVEQLRSHSLGVMLERLEAQGAVDNFRRVGDPGLRRRALHFSDSDVYKWVEASVLAGREDLAAPVIDVIVAAQRSDGYLHTYYDTDGAPARYTDLDFGHEHYCFGHLIEAAVSHHEVTGSSGLLETAGRLADHLCDTFGPDRDPRTDAHPEVELALVRLARATGEHRYVQQAAWTIEQRLTGVGSSLEQVGLDGHAVRALYLASGITEVASATGDARWVETAARLFTRLVDEHAYPTGAVGARWLGEAVGRPFEQPDALAYAESCAAVAATQLARRIWQLTGDARALEQIELLLYNAVPCGVGAGGDTWFYSQPQSVGTVAGEANPWLHGIDYGQLMLLEWFPARRHDWFAVPCCPPNLGRMFATVDRHVAEVDPAGDLLVHLPMASRIRGEGWDVEIVGGYPFDGDIRVRVHEAPPGRALRVRRPLWAGGGAHEAVGPDGRISLPVEWTWWTTDPRVESAADTVFLRRGPVVHCIEGLDHPGVDLRDIVVDPTRPPDEAFARRGRTGPSALHHVYEDRAAASRPITPTPIPYAQWANRGTTTMRVRFPTA